MAQMRLRMNEHIVYLQNEVRKRDELLESTSDFNDSEADADADEDLLEQSVNSGIVQGKTDESIHSSARQSFTRKRKGGILSTKLDEARD